jgi:tetratricopeptide (TPR) repeat protein
MIKVTLTRTLAFVVILAGQITLTHAEPLIDGLGDYRRPISTRSPEAQRYFNQGLAWFHGFNHGAAIRSFEEAARLDPDCAMAHWGIALACGPHINVPMVTPAAAEQAWQAITRARALAHQGTPVERALIAALAERYADPQPDDRGPLDRAYAEAMRQTWQAYPQDPDVGALFAEAMMTLRPWDLWTAEGRPQPGTEEVVATLEAALRLNKNHPFANHLYIHALEASPQPEKAAAAADRLRDLQPALAHNVHMPSHIDIRNGRWQDAITANLKAIDAAKRLRARLGPPPLGPIHIYHAHNHHMLAYAAMMTGQSDLAITQIHAMVAGLPDELLQGLALVTDGYVAMPYEVLLRFGRWDDVLAAPDHPEYLPFARAIRRMARGIAFAAKGSNGAGTPGTTGLSCRDRGRPGRHECRTRGRADDSRRGHAHARR